MDLAAKGSNFEAAAGDVKIVIGDATKACFMPHVRLEKWGEYGMSICLPTAKVVEPENVDGVVSWNGAAKFWMDGDEVEFLLILNEVPQGAFIPLDFDFTGLSVFYQSPTFTQAEIDAAKKAGATLNERPERVKDSWAIYCDKANGKYQSGKVGHLYRLKAKDANGDEAWLTWYVKDGLPAGIKVDDWLLNAAYPVDIDPTLGTTTDGGSSIGVGAGFVGAHGTYQMSENGDSTQFNFKTDGLPIGQSFRGGIYNAASSGADAGSLVSETGSTAVADLTVLQTAALTGSLTSGNYYRLGLQNNGAVSGNINVLYDGTSAFWEYRTFSYAAFPNPFSTKDGDLSYRLTIWLDYTASGGAAAQNLLTLLGVG